MKHHKEAWLMSTARTLMFRVPIAYVVAQVLTGVEIGTLAASLVFMADLQLPLALGIVFPLGIPLVSLQMAGVISWLGRRQEISPAVGGELISLPGRLLEHQSKAM
jgi:hypothetical protein